MLNRKTRSNKNLELVELSNQELAKLERKSQKTDTSEAMLRTIIRADEEGILRDAEGHAYNDAGQRVDENGQLIEEAVQVDGVARHQPAVGDGVARHPLAVDVGDVEVNGVDRHQPQGVARHQHAGIVGHGAHGAVIQRGMTLGDYNRPEQFYANRSAIRPPQFQRNDFELKPAYYTLVGQNPFHGFSHEHPMDHIEQFEDLVTSIKANGVSYDYLFCKLFPYSLAGEATYWLKQLKPGSLTTWEDTKNAFLSNFYDDARSEELRTRISAFSQGPTEAFKAAWARFRSYQRDCPHHGFSEVQLLGIFFRGVDWRYQMALDAASNGNFNTRYPDDAVILIENLASSNSTKNADFERKKQAVNVDGSQMAEVKAKLDTVHNILVGKKQVQFAAEVETYEPVDEHEGRDVNFIGGTGFQRFGNSQGNGNYSGGSPRGNYSGNQSYAQKPQYQPSSQNSSNFTRNYCSSSYQSTPPPTNESKMESMLAQILEGQQKMTVNFNEKMDAMYMDLNGKIEALSNHQKKLDIQVAQVSAAVKGKMVHSHNEHVHAITPRSKEEIEDEAVAVMKPVSIDTTLPCRSTPATKNDTDSNPGASVDRHQPSVDRHPSQDIPEIERTPKIVEERVYKPIPPYPRASKTYNALVQKMSWQFPEVHEFRDLPNVKKVIDKAYTEEICLNDAVDLIYLECSAILHSRLPEELPDPESIPTQSLRQLTKREDPGKFSVPCSISGVEFKESLVDSGSGANIMSRAIAERLRIDIKPTVMTLTFANNATSRPYGTIPDLLIKVGDCLVPTDFQVVEMSERCSTPLILGRPFMATAGAVIDTPSERISFSYIDKEVSYKAIPSGRASKRISCITIDTLDIDVELPEELSIDTNTMCRSTPAAIYSTCKDKGVSIDITSKDSKPLIGVDRYQPPVSIDTHHGTSQKVKRRDKPKSDRKFTCSAITLTPQRRVGDAIEYKVKCKGMSKPFSKVKALITSELKAQGQAAVDNALSKVLKLNMHDHKIRAPRLSPPPPLPDPSSDSHHP